MIDRGEAPVDDVTADVDTQIDGRVARRQRNVNTVIDGVLEMFGEEQLFPTMEQAAERSGLSLRSLYRYFTEPSELLEAAIVRSNARGVEISQLHAIGEGPLADRMEAFVSMRLRLHDAVGSVYRATVANAAQHPRVQLELGRNRSGMQAQFAMQFAPELDQLRGATLEAVLSAGDLITQMESIDYLRRQRNLSKAKTHAVLIATLESLFS